MSDRVRAIAIEALTHFDVCASGRQIEIGFMDHGGKPGRLYVSQASLGSLLPSLAAAMQETGGAGDGELTCAHPLLDWRLQRDHHNNDVMVLTLQGSNAVEVAFRLPAPVASALGQALLTGCAPQALRRRACCASTTDLSWPSPRRHG